MTSHRTRQIAEGIRTHIAMMLLKGEITDPRVKGVTLNSVKVSPDLQIARVYYTCMSQDEAKRAEVQAGLVSASGYIRRALGDALRLRFTPHVHFHFDDSVDYALHMTKIMSGVSQELAESRARDEAEAPKDDAPSPDKDTSE